VGVKTVRTALVAVWTVVAPVFASACHAPAAPPPAPHRVDYRLTWAHDDVTPARDGSWSVTNDLGYEVRVKRGWITSYSMELVECPKAALFEWLGPRAAWAGHASGTPNPAAIRPMQVEALTQPTGHDVGSVTLAPQPYFQLHYLVARAGKDAPGLPDGIDMVDASLHLEGSYRAPGGGAETPFTVHTAVAYGQLFDRTARSDRVLHVDTGRESVRVEVRRRRRHMFDRVDFSRMAERQLALQILTSFVNDAEVEITRVE